MIFGFEYLETLFFEKTMKSEYINIDIVFSEQYCSKVIKIMKSQFK